MNLIFLNISIGIMSFFIFQDSSYIELHITTYCYWILFSYYILSLWNQYLEHLNPVNGN